MPKRASPSAADTPPSLFARLRRLILRALLLVIVVLALIVLAYRVLPVPATPYMMSERIRLGVLDRDWTPLESISPNLQRAVVAAEDANYCTHWGFDISALRDAIEGGAQRGGSTITQQTVKNVFLWQGRSWPRKALEALLTPVVELAWGKRRILEIYLNVAEFDSGVFGAGAAAPHYFDIAAADLTLREAARLAAVLPNPKARDAASLSPRLQRRAAAIADGAATIQRDGRAACFGG